MHTLAFLLDFGQWPSLDGVLWIVQMLFSFISSRSFPYTAILSKALNTFSLVWWLGYRPCPQAAQQSELGSRKHGLWGWNRQSEEAGGCDLLQQHWVQKGLCVHSLWTTILCQEYQKSVVSLLPHLPSYERVTFLHLRRFFNCFVDV